MKLTLLDYPGKVACTVFLQGCNFKCPFCHNASLVRCDGDEMDINEFLGFIKSRFGILDGVCVTGGEPTLYPELYNFIKEIKAIGYSVKLDTNGTNPEMLKRLIGDGLVDFVAMDIKNSPSKYPLTCGVGVDLEKIRESIQLLLGSDISFEFRTTVVKELHEDRDFEEIGEFIKGAPRYFLQCFKDSGDIIADGMSAPSEGDMKRYLSIIKKYIPSAKLRGID